MTYDVKLNTVSNDNLDKSKSTKTKSKAKKVFKIILDVISVLLGALFLTVIIQNLIVRTDKEYIPSILNHTYLTVLSGSMEPEIKQYDLVIGKQVKDISKLNEGDVITFKDQNMLVTHRINKINDDGTIATKGDANAVVDAKIVTFDNVVSKNIACLPKMGYVVLKLQDGAFLAILWIIVMYFIISEIIKERKKVKQKSKKADEVAEAQSLQESVQTQ